MIPTRFSTKSILNNRNCGVNFVYSFNKRVGIFYYLKINFPFLIHVIEGLFMGGKGSHGGVCLFLFGFFWPGHGACGILVDTLD